MPSLSLQICILYIHTIERVRAVGEGVGGGVGGSRIDEIPYWTGQLGHSIHFLFSEAMTNIILFTKEITIIFFSLSYLFLPVSNAVNISQNTVTDF